MKKGKGAAHKVNNIERAANLNLRINNVHAIYMILRIRSNDSMDDDYKYNWDEMIKTAFSYLSRESGKEKTKVRPDCSFAPTQLALCLGLAYFRFKRRELTTRRNPR